MVNSITEQARDERELWWRHSSREFTRGVAGMRRPISFDYLEWADHSQCSAWQMACPIQTHTHEHDLIQAELRHSSISVNISIWCRLIFFIILTFNMCILKELNDIYVSWMYFLSKLPTIFEEELFNWWTSSWGDLKVIDNWLN